MDNNLIKTLPETATKMMDWSWAKIEPYYKELTKYNLNVANVNAYLRDWTKLHDLVDEVFNRLYVAKDVNTADKKAEQSYEQFLNEIYPKVREFEQALKAKLLDWTEAKRF